VFSPLGRQDRPPPEQHQVMRGPAGGVSARRGQPGYAGTSTPAPRTGSLTRLVFEKLVWCYVGTHSHYRRPKGEGTFSRLAPLAARHAGHHRRSESPQRSLHARCGALRDVGGTTLRAGGITVRDHARRDQRCAIPLTTLNPAIPIQLARVVKKALEKSPEKRLLISLLEIEGGAT
jgi:hypothetical protein